MWVCVGVCGGGHEGGWGRVSSHVEDDVMDGCMPYIHTCVMNTQTVHLCTYVHMRVSV